VVGGFAKITVSRGEGFPKDSAGGEVFALRTIVRGVGWEGLLR
jgi:hypothetical protein